MASAGVVGGRPAAVAASKKVVPFASRNAASWRAVSHPPMARAPMQERPKRVGSSAVVETTKRSRCGTHPAPRNAFTAAIPPSTPTVPSYAPDKGMASMWEPVATVPRSGFVPRHRPRTLPTPSTLTSRPASRINDFT
jgi:hypothetical protein